MWTSFMDMNSGGGRKEKNYEYIYIEAPENEAKVIFYNRFGHNPERVSCTCCGGDYSISEYDSLEQATAYQKNCKYDEETKNILVIYSKDIKDSERIGEVSEQGYIWRD